MNKHQKTTGIIYYQKARFFRKSDTNEFAYCIEPFAFFNQPYSYESSLSPDVLTSPKLDRITKIAHFGYGYGNHTDVKWYAITQFMIWQEADSSTGEYYFTDSLNGNRINIFQDEMNEINYLVDNYSTLPSFSNKEFTIAENDEFSIVDNNDVLKYYSPNNKELTVDKNILKVKSLKKGQYTFTLTRKSVYLNKPTIFYHSPRSQDLVITGDISEIHAVLHLNVVNTSIKITKIDEDTLSITPSGEASLDGAVYNLYDENNNLIKELTIKDNQALIENIKFGKYYLKEKTPGKGYTLDNNTYEVIINENNTDNELVLKNKVIEKKIIIEKKYGDTKQLKGEENISFEIYNKDKELIDTITTDSNGLVEITLPFGTYEFVQINSTEGYQKVDSFTVNIEDDEEEHIDLRDLKIEVPNTHTEESNLLLLYLLKLLLIIW